MVKSTDFWSKIYIMDKDTNFGQTHKFRSKIQILVKNTNVGQKYKFWSKTQILVKNANFGKIVKRHKNHYFKLHLKQPKFKRTKNADELGAWFDWGR